MLKKSVSTLLVWALLSMTAGAQSLTQWQNGDERGMPGKNYWQQQADYSLSVNVDPRTRSLTGQGTLVYHNNSPQALSELWLELPQQYFRQKGLKVDGVAAGSETLMVSHQGQRLPLKREATFYGVTLTTPLAPGQRLKLTLSWDLQFIDRRHALEPRAGFEAFDDGSLTLAVAQWFPRVLAFDKSTGWQRIPFGRNGEFHLETGNYDVQITVPADMVVAATGSLINASQVLTPEANEQFHRQNTVTQRIDASAPDAKAVRRWHFQAHQVRDFAFATGNNWVWERRVLPTQYGRTALNVFYPDNGRYLWRQYAMQAASHSVHFLDSQVAPFPDAEYSVVNIAGLGMEYPGITWVGFRGPDQQGDETPPFSRTQKYDVIGGIIHEVGHVYFPMSVNTNERAQGFFDEGLTSYLAFRTEQAFSRDFQSFYGFAEPAAKVMAQSNYPAPISQADTLSHAHKLAAHYHIPAVAHNLLRDYLGEKAFDHLLTEFLRQWRGKRAYFGDWINFVNHRSDKALDWFWQPWLGTDQHLDIAIAGRGNESEPQLVLENRGGLLAPIQLNLLWQDGRIERRVISPSDWKQETRLKVPLPARGVLSGAVLDPQHKVPDTNRQNNRWYPNG